MDTTAALKENTAETTCRGCKSRIVLFRSSIKTIKTLAMCPKCGAGIKHIW
jgi:Zn finger protein HypA/HybF involved in hydrogenase expression